MNLEIMAAVCFGHSMARNLDASLDDIAKLAFANLKEVVDTANLEDPPSIEYMASLVMNAVKEVVSSKLPIRH